VNAKERRVKALEERSGGNSESKPLSFFYGEEPTQVELEAIRQHRGKPPLTLNHFYEAMSASP